MARALLMGVAITHRQLLEKIDLPIRQGTPPTLQEVTNALRSRDDRDNMVEEANTYENGGREAVVMNVKHYLIQPNDNGTKTKNNTIKCFHYAKNGHYR